MQATLKQKRLIARETDEFEFDLQGNTADFHSGQYCEVTLPRIVQSGSDRPRRKFSIVNTPNDNTHIVIATRAGYTDFKHTLYDLQPGDSIIINEIGGDLGIPEKSTTEPVFIAGGIGITPILSMLRDLESRDRLHNATLLYFNRDSESTPYLTELQAMKERNPHFTLIMSMTRDPQWKKETEKISPEILRKYIRNVRTPIYYVIGTPPLVDATKKALADVGVDEKAVFDEDFSGYSRYSNGVMAPIE